MKKGLIAIIVSVLFPLLLVLLLFVAIVPDEDEKKTDSETAGYSLPVFITADMMEAFFETQKEEGIPVSSGVAQMIAESGFGIYGPNGDSGQGLSQLAYQYKNLFGIKYFSGDAYATGVKDFSTGEQTSTGGGYTVTAGFSIYPDYGSCIRQRARMLMQEPYYSKTVALYPNKNDKKYSKQDADNFVSGIREAGWATDISYVTKLQKHMTTYNLYQFDNMTWAQYQAGKGAGGNIHYNGEVKPIMKKISDVARNNEGTYPCTPDMCAAWVTGVYQAAGASVIPYGNAIDMWNTFQLTGSTSRDNIPPGAIVCGSGSGYMGALYGHVGIYLGDGMVANNIGSFSVETLENWSSWQTASCQGHVGWIGWVYPGGIPQ